MANKRIKDLASTAVGWDSNTAYLPLDSDGAGTQKVLVDTIVAFTAATIRQYPNSYSPLFISNPVGVSLDPYIIVGLDQFGDEAIGLENFNYKYDITNNCYFRDKDGLENNLGGIFVTTLLDSPTDTYLPSKVFSFEAFPWTTVLNDLIFNVDGTNVSFYGGDNNSGAIGLPYYHIQIWSNNSCIVSLDQIGGNVQSITGGYVSEDTYFDLSDAIGLGNVVIPSKSSTSTDNLIISLASAISNGLGHTGYLEIACDAGCLNTAASATELDDLESWGWTTSIYEV